MKVKLVLVSALVAGVVNAAGMAQTAAPAAPATAATAPAAPPPPQAIPAKIAVIEMQEAAAATNEGQQAILSIQKKYEPQKAALDSLKAQIDSLTKELQNAPASMSDDEKASRSRTINTKQQQLQRDADDFSTAANQEVGDAIAKVTQKMGPVIVKYLRQNGFTLLLDNTGPPQQGGMNVLWYPDIDVSQAVVDAYNAASGVAAPAPSAPAARPRPAAPKPAAPKQ